MDYVNVIAHIFYKETRYLQFRELWGRCPKKKISILK